MSSSDPKDGGSNDERRLKIRDVVYYKKHSKHEVQTATGILLLHRGHLSFVSRELQLHYRWNLNAIAVEKFNFHRLSSHHGMKILGTPQREGEDEDEDEGEHLFPKVPEAAYDTIRCSVEKSKLGEDQHREQAPERETRQNAVETGTRPSAHAWMRLGAKSLSGLQRRRSSVEGKGVDHVHPSTRVPLQQSRERLAERGDAARAGSDRRLLLQRSESLL